MVPLLPTGLYLRLAASVFGRRPALFFASIFSEILALVSMVGPVYLAFLASGASAPKVPPSTADAITQEVLVGLPTTGVQTLALVFVLWGGLMLTRAGIDTHVARSARQILARDPRYTLPWIGHFVGFLSSHILGLALALAMSFFLTPIVGRIVLRSAVSADINYIAFGLVAMGTAVFFGHQLRLLMHFIQGWIAWRGEFIAGAFGSGLASPIKNVKSWILLSTIWGLPSSLLVSVLTLIFVVRGVSSIETMLALQSTTATMFLVATLWSQLSAWVCLSVLMMVGHQIGDVATQTVEERARPVKSLFRKIDASDGDQAVIPSAPRGFFKVEGHHPPLTFEDILGKPKGFGEIPDDWTSEAENSQVTARSTTAGGGSEVSLTFERPDGLFAAETSKPRVAAPTPNIITENHQTIEEPNSSLLGPSFNHGAEDQRGLQRLGDSLSPSIVRTHAGDPEVRFRGPKA